MPIEIEDRDKPLFMISAVAEMVGMHPQTLRQYERMGLVGPKRSRGKTRLYSYRDIELLRLIHSLTRDRGVNLAGVRLFLDLQRRVDDMQREMRKTLELLMESMEGGRGTGSAVGGAAKGKRLRIRIDHG